MNPVAGEGRSLWTGFLILSALSVCCSPGNPGAPEPCGLRAWSPGEVWYASAEAEGEEDGSFEHPYSSIQDAMDDAGEAGGGRVVVGPGAYAEALRFGLEHSGVSVEGTCRDAVIIEGGDEETAAVSVSGLPDTRIALHHLTVIGVENGVEVRRGVNLLGDLRIEGGATGLRLVSTSPSSTYAELRDIEVIGTGDYGAKLFNAVAAFDGLTIEGAMDVGLYVEASSNVTLRDAAVRGTRASTGEIGFGTGIFVENSRLALSGAEISENASFGLYADRGSVVEMTDARVLSNYQEGIRAWGVRGGGLGEGDWELDPPEEGRFDRRAGGRPTTLRLHDVSVEETRYTGEGGFIRGGVAIYEGARLEATGLFLRNNNYAGLVLSPGNGLAVTAEVSDLDVIQSAPTEEGQGIAIQTLADEAWGTGGPIELRIQGAWIGAYACRALLAGGSDVNVSLFDVLIEGERGTCPGQGRVAIEVRDDAQVELSQVEVRGGDTWGIEAVDGGVIEATGLRIEDVFHIGAIVDELGRLNLVDSIIRGVRGPPDAPAQGLAVNDGSYLWAQGLELIDNQGTSLFVLEADADVEDLVVTGTRAGPYLRLGTAVGVGEGELRITNGVITDNEGPGVLNVGGGFSCTTCEISRNGFAGLLQEEGWTELDDVSLEANAEDPVFSGGYGIYAYTSSFSVELSLDGCTVADNRLIGLLLGEAGSYRITDSRIFGGPGVDAGGEIVYGYGVVAGSEITAWDGVDGLLIEGSEINDSAGAAVLLDGGGVRLVETEFSGNAANLIAWPCRAELPDDWSAAEPLLDACPESRDAIIYPEFDFLLEANEYTTSEPPAG